MTDNATILGTINLPRDSTLQTLAGEMATANMLKRLELKKAGIDLTASDWKSFQSMVRAGTLLAVYSIGSQFKTMRGDDALIWDLVHYGEDDNGKYAVLQMHDCYKNALQFGTRQAFFYANADLPAGTYHVTFTKTNWPTYEGIALQFTTTKVVPKGGQLTLSADAWLTTLPKSVVSYSASTSATAIETVALTKGNVGTDLSTLGTINHCQKAVYGNNNYKESALRQWLNSDKTVGGVWTPQQNYDRPPAWATTEDGFMNGLDEEFVSVVSKEKIKTALNTLTDGGGFVETNDKFFIPAAGQENFNDTNNIDEGKPWDYYTKFRADGKIGRNDADDTNRLKYYNNKVRHYWLRTPYVSYAFHYRIVYISGRLNHRTAQGTFGVAPACIIR
jgi:hypothetical protein